MPPAAAPSPALRRWSTGVALAGFALATLRWPAETWRVSPHYGYGWIVPLLAAWLGFSRWSTRPAVGSPSAPTSLGVGLAGVATLYLPLRLVVEAFPDWRPALWGVAFALVAASLLFAAAGGGRAWVKHFSFPALFLLTAIPWPTPVEAPIVHGLMRWNAAVAVDLLTFFGHPALQRGSIIEVGGGAIGVDEACSGLRSLQAAVMLALLFGEVFRLGWGRRVALLGVGLLLALTTNLARTLWLVRTAQHDGPAGVGAAHDPAGWATLAVCVAGIGAAAWSARNRRPIDVAAANTARLEAPVWFSFVLLALVASGEIGAAWWYRAREDSGPAAMPWTLAWPKSAREFQVRPIRPAVREVLRCDTAEAAEWRGADDATAWTVHRVRWEPRSAREAILAAYHTPDVCLPASGCLQREELGEIVVGTAAGALRFRGYVFEELGAPLYVFYLLHEDRAGSRVVESAGRERLRLVAAGRRRTGQTVLHVVLRGPSDGAAARAVFTRQFPALIETPR